MKGNKLVGRHFKYAAPSSPQIALQITDQDALPPDGYWALSAHTSVQERAFQIPGKNIGLLYTTWLISRMSGEDGQKLCRETDQADRNNDAAPARISASRKSLNTER
jgi:hypothetical protein